MKHLWILGAILVMGCQNSGTLNGSELLKLTLNYHDPNRSWGALKTTVYYDEYRSDSVLRKSVVHFNNLDGSFKMERANDNLVITRGTLGDSCYVLVNGSAEFDAELGGVLNLDCNRSFLYRDYYQYIQGLPMKLQDPGTVIAPDITKVHFMENEYYKLKVTYEEKIGSDVWYFYVNPENYAIEVYQFFHHEDQGDGEYILLEGKVEVNGMTWPRERIWYSNQGDQYLGRDVIVEIL